MLKDKLIYSIEIMREIDANPGIRSMDIAENIVMSRSNVEIHLCDLREAVYVIGKRGHGGGYCMNNNVDFASIVIYDLAEDLGLNRPRSLSFDFAKQHGITAVDLLSPREPL